MAERNIPRPQKLPVDVIEAGGSVVPDILTYIQDLPEGLQIIRNSNKPEHRPEGGNWGSYIIFKKYQSAGVLYVDGDLIAYANPIGPSSTEISWRIFSRKTDTSGSITKSSNVTSGTLDSTTCYKVGNTVHVSGRIHSMSNQVANGSFFIISEGFRPQINTRALGFISINDIGNTPILTQINTDGTVNFSYSNSKTCTEVQFSASYSI